MRSSFPGLRAELISTSGRTSDSSGKRTSGWCSRSRCAAASFAALLLFAVLLFYQLKVLQTRGSTVIDASDEAVKIAVRGTTPQALSAATEDSTLPGTAAQQLLHSFLGPFKQVAVEPGFISRPLSQLFAQQLPCPNNCSNVGNCLGDLGVCQCPGAWRGVDCSEQKQRPCTSTFAPPGSSQPASHVDAEGRDLNATESGWLFGRCSGVCDLQYGHCYCPPIGKYGRVNPPPGSPPGAPAVKEGRPLAHPCKAPNADAAGHTIDWGTPNLSWDTLFGPKGWCVVDTVTDTPCSCQLDGWDGPGCSIRTESMCLNQCSRRGVCHERGFCQCQPGWYGIDCAHPSSQEAAKQAPRAGGDAWLQTTSVDAWQCYSSGAGCLEDVMRGIYLQNPHLSRDSSGGTTRSSRGGVSRRGHAPLPSYLQPPREAATGDDTSVPGRISHTNSSNSSSSSSNGASPASAQASPPISPSSQTRLLLEAASQGPAPHQRPAAQNSSQPAAAAAAGPTMERLRPLIYIYNAPEEVNSHVLQYRESKGTCAWRQWEHMDGVNSSRLVKDTTYAVEAFLPELLMGSRHRTLDPEEADYFLVPVLSACYMTHVSATHDFPWFYQATHRRVKGAAVMYWHALNWVRAHYPYWNASRGADHIWIFPHDEGACWAPQEVYQNSIILAHWGRNTSDNLPSHTQYVPDNYTHNADAQDNQLPVPYTQLIGKHRCYTPGKDLVLPVIKMPSHYQDSPFLSGYQPPRDILGFHKGRMGVNPLFGPSFSLGVRQTVAQAAEAEDWAVKHNVHVGSNGSAVGVYSQLLSRSVFCLVLQGEGWTARFDDAILHGCIPAVVIDDTVGPWGSELDWESFSIRISSKNITNIPSILAAVPQHQVVAMQEKLEQVWHRFAWLTHPMIAQEVNQIQKAALGGKQRAKGRKELKDRTLVPPGEAVEGFPKLTMQRIEQDAFHSLMQVLGSWVPQRGSAAARHAAQQQQQQRRRKRKQQQQKQEHRQQKQQQQQQQQEQQPPAT